MRKKIYLPLKKYGVCGHTHHVNGRSVIGGDLMSGNEEGLMCVEGKKATYIRNYIYGSCSKCYKNHLKEMEREVAEIENA